MVPIRERNCCSLARSACTISRRVADREADRHQAAVAAHRFDLGVVGRGRGAVGQVAEQACAVVALIFGHQEAHVAAHDLVAAPAEDLLGRGIELEDGAGAVDRDHAVDGRGEQGAHPGFAAREFAVQAAVAQQAVGGQHQHREQHGDQGNADRQRGGVGRGGGVRVDAADEAGGGHAGVVHARDGAAHHGGRQQQAARFADAGQAAQAEAYPQRERGQYHGHHDRQQEDIRVVAQLQAHLHAFHAGVVHGADAGADQHAADQQPAGAQAFARDQAQGDVGGEDARQARQDGGHRVVGDLGAQVKGEHADEVHGPDAGAQRQAAGQQEDRALAVALAAVLTSLAGDLQAHPRRKDRDEQRQQHELGIVDAVAEQRRIIGQHEKRHGVFRESEISKNES